MPATNQIKPVTGATAAYVFAQTAGVVAALAGLMVIASWHAHWIWFIQLIPDTAPMPYNSALSFVLAGSALLVVTGKRKALGAGMGCLAAIIPLLTSFEYAFGKDFGIDEVFFSGYVTASARYPGRMSPLTALCFVFIAGSLALAAVRRGRQFVLTGTGILACVVAEIGCVALVGYAAGISADYAWGAYSQMAMNSATLFVLVGAGVSAWTLEAARNDGFDLRHLLPVSVSVALMVMIVIVLGNGAFQMQKAAELRTYIFDETLKAQAVEQNLANMQSSLRTYISSGDTNILASYRSHAELASKRLKELRTMIVENSDQWKRLLQLTGIMEKALTADERTLTIFRQSGAGPAMSSDSQRQSLAASAEARDILHAFLEDEKTVFVKRDGKEQNDFRGVSRLLVLGSGTSLVLLVAAFYMASHQMKLRRRAEMEREKLIAELQKALAEVRTLSGMIPICAWCKNIRSDEGFWQSVEEYLCNHTHAEFSHGMCPKCSERMQKELKGE